MTLAALFITLAGLALADHITGTAWYQTKGHDMQPDHYDIFDDDEHGATSDYWEAYLSTPGALPMGLVAGDDATIGWAILTDEELAEIDSEVDDWPESDVPDDDLLWFYSAGESEEYDDDDADYRPDYIGGY